MKNCVAKQEASSITRKIDFERLAEDMFQLPQAICDLEHMFAPGVYMRMIHLPAGSMILGHEHKTEHFNILLSGSGSTLSEGKIIELKAPMIFKSGAGAQKLILVVEPMLWLTVHESRETNIEKLEDMLVVKSEVVERHRLKNRTVKNGRIKLCQS